MFFSKYCMSKLLVCRGPFVFYSEVHFLSTVLFPGCNAPKKILTHILAWFLRYLPCYRYLYPLLGSMNSQNREYQWWTTYTYVGGWNQCKHMKIAPHYGYSIRKQDLATLLFKTKKTIFAFLFKIFKQRNSFKSVGIYSKCSHAI